jgi:two-component system response regulator AlgR
MKILIVDDEAPAREHLRYLVKEIGAPYEVAGEAMNGKSALDLCGSEPVDVVLMDIRMPGMGGLEAALLLSHTEMPPAVIFTTAYEEHTLEAFERNAVDYLLKPIRRERLERALQRVHSLTRPQLKALESLQETPAQYVVSQFRGGIQRIPVEEVLYFRAEQKYVIVRHLGGEAILEDSLKSLEDRFGEQFLRIHRNALVAKARVVELEREPDGRRLIRLEGLEEGLEVSRRHLPDVRRWIKEA